MSKPQRTTAEIVILNEANAADDAAMRDAVAAAETVGGKLAAARKAKGLTLEDVHVGTKVKLNHLGAIELGDQSALPAVPFAAGFVKAYAQFLGLDANDYSAAYKAEFGGAAAAAKTPAPQIETAAEAPAIARAPAARNPFVATPKTEAAPAIFPPAPAEPALSAPAPAAAVADKASSPDRFVAYFGVGAACLCVAWIAGNALLSNQNAPAPTVTFTAVAPAAEPPAAPAIVAQAPAASPSTAEIAAAEAPPVAENDLAATALIEPPKVKPTPKPVRAPSPDMKEIIIADAPPVVSKPGAAAAGAAPIVSEQIDPFALSAPAAGSASPTLDATIVPAKLTRAASPKYPERCAAGSRKAEGVSVAFDVTVEGRPTNANVADSSNSCFNDAAKDTVYRMRFSPRMIDGQAQMEFGKRVTVQFTR